MKIGFHERDPQGKATGQVNPQDPALYLNLCTVQMNYKYIKKFLGPFLVK